MTRQPPDRIAILLLILLWMLFFWRLFTPIRADQASLKQGDFSAQFVAFGGYQYARWSEGEVPLWNPYNNGGLPFIADTQAAVFYPPRLLTIALVNVSGTGWTYHALELEMTFHVLFYTLTMYWLVRRMTGNALAGFVAAIVGGYGGYVSGYPPLQLALLEAGVWLPLAVLGVFEATPHPLASSPSRGEGKKRIRWQWLVLTGFALGLSWMAGHPQTSFFLTYLLIAYFVYRLYTLRASIRDYVLGITLFGIIALGVVAVTLLPGIEYLLLTSRSDLGFEAKGGGFPFQDIIQLLYPGLVSLFSPLYVGITAFALIVAAVWRRVPESLFWVAVAVFALLLSVGENSVLYHLLYNILPGLRFFRGQERAAYLVANSFAILAGLGVTALVPEMTRRLRIGLGGLLLICGAIAAAVFVLWLNSRDGYGAVIPVVVFSALIVAILLWLLPETARKPNWRPLLALLIVFELFSVNINAESNYDSIPPDEQLQPNPLLDIPLADNDLPFRVDGFRVLGGNFGSLYELADIQGISPLFLTDVQEIIEYGLPNEIAWELFSVRYVYSDWEALTVPGELLARGEDERGAVNLHRLTAQRPYALLMYDAVVVADDAAARDLLADPEFIPRETVILEQDPSIDLTGDAPEGAGATVTRYGPEALTVIANTPVPAVLSLAQVDYPGWYATVNGENVDILRAYGGLSAVVVPAGESTVELVFNPLTYRIGAILSLVTWSGLAILAVILTVRRVRYADE
jgi:hypothetical protein